MVLLFGGIENIKSIEETIDKSNDQGEIDKCK
jgi:hypothetical protein